MIGGVPGMDRLLYLGPRYGRAERPHEGVLIPEVVTLSMEWDAPGGDGGQGRTLTKPIGGFFVGCSPEGLMALGLIRALTESGKMAVINGAEYQLDLHRLDHARGIRTFFPRFVKAHVIDIVEGGEDTIDIGGDTLTPGGVQDTLLPGELQETLVGPGGSDILHGGDGRDVLALEPFHIIAAMINPVNPEGGREFLQIINTSDQTWNLLGWTVTAPNGTRFTLAARDVAPGEVFRFTVPRNDGVLRNRGGTITLHRPDGVLAQSCTYTATDAGREGAVVLF